MSRSATTAGGFSQNLPTRKSGVGQRPRIRSPSCIHPYAGSGRSATMPSTTTRSRRACTIRSEEHTSELQSRLHLVCRLLLEKKKKTDISELLHDMTEI